ncbi:MAG: hypothetical protein IKY51_03140 [Alistipes sp.]|nr:hypothetical protein [Alistipes sp.]
MAANIAKLMLLEVKAAASLTDEQCTLLQCVIDIAYDEGHMDGYQKAVQVRNDFLKPNDTNTIQDKPRATTH